MPTPVAILVIDDEPDLLDNICLPLEAEGYQVLTAPDGLAALRVLESKAVDLILADIAMPNLNGYQLYEKVRENPDWVTIPFIFLSARSLDTDIHYGKELGADDYLTKPIRGRDLVAVVRGKLKRAQQIARSMAQLQREESPQEKGEALIQVGPLQIDVQQHRVRVGHQEIKLSAREFLLLEHLGREPGRVVPPSDLIKTSHDYEADPVEAGNLVRPLMVTLRRKLGLESGTVGSIENVRGVGYRLVTPD
jgi:DNA-binding response OmpR family regulator